MTAGGSRHDDWDQHWADFGTAASGNPAQLLRRRLVRRLLHVRPPARVLDVGCGQGDLVAELRRDHPAGVELAGIDYSHSGVRMAARKVPAATFVCRDLTRPGDAADLAGWATHAVCSEVLEHVDDPRTLLENTRAYLAPGCRLVVTVPGGPRSAFDRHIGHRRHFSPDALGVLLTAAGYRVERTMGAGFPFFNLYRLAVIARGRRLIDDVGSPGEGAGAAVSLPARAAMAAFGALFHLNLPVGRFGWQVVGVASLEAPAPGSLDTA